MAEMFRKSGMKINLWNEMLLEKVKLVEQICKNQKYFGWFLMNNNLEFGWDNGYKSHVNRTD